MASSREIALLNPSVKPMKHVLLVISLCGICASSWAPSHRAWDVGNEVARVMPDITALNVGTCARGGAGILLDSGLRSPLAWMPTKLFVEDVASSESSSYLRHEEPSVTKTAVEDACSQTGSNLLPAWTAAIVVGFMVFSFSLVNPTALCLILLSRGGAATLLDPSPILTASRLRARRTA